MPATPLDLRIDDICPGIEMLKMDGFDDCVVGVINRFGAEPILCYDQTKVINTLMRRDGMERDEAEEFFAFNQIGAWMGELTPCFLTRFNPIIKPKPRKRKS